jgi:hypothetical protein
MPVSHSEIAYYICLYFLNAFALSPSLLLTSISRETASQSLARRAKLEVTSINKAISPGAKYLYSQRTWTGLGSDFSKVEASENIEEGRSSIARGYTVGKGRDCQ